MYRLLLLICVFFSSACFSAGSVYTGFFSNKAINGYDPISFFENNLVKGNTKYKANYKGAVWLFKNQQNLDTFLKQPENYAPQYGGYCAWAIAEKNNLVSGNPKYWKIVDGKLYLNYDKETQDKWERNIPQFILKGDKNWISR